MLADQIGCMTTALYAIYGTTFTGLIILVIWLICSALQGT
jgi:hypothetical protein